MSPRSPGSMSGRRGASRCCASRTRRARRSASRRDITLGDRTRGMTGILQGASGGRQLNRLRSRKRRTSSYHSLSTCGGAVNHRRCPAGPSSGVMRAGRGRRCSSRRDSLRLWRTGGARIRHPRRTRRRRGSLRFPRRGAGGSGVSDRRPFPEGSQPRRCSRGRNRFRSGRRNIHRCNWRRRLRSPDRPCTSIEVRSSTANH